MMHNDETRNGHDIQRTANTSFPLSPVPIRDKGLIGGERESWFNLLPVAGSWMPAPEIASFISLEPPGVTITLDEPEAGSAQVEQLETRETLTAINVKRCFYSSNLRLTCVIRRTRVDLKPREKGNNQFGRSGNLRCRQCRNRHRKVLVPSRTL